MTDNTLTRRTFAIISHPDAGKTTLTEKLLLYGGAITLAGAVKGKKARRHATSDWMELERQRGISVTTSVMQFEYAGHILNLLDTPGHEDFSEDTYRTLTAVDSALMVIDGAKGVEDRTIKLMEICRLRATPIVTFVNKWDREARDPIELLDEIEHVLKMPCAPITWPIGRGKTFCGIYHLIEDCAYIYVESNRETIREVVCVPGLHNPELDQRVGDEATFLREAMELVKGAASPYHREAFLQGQLTPVYFGSAIQNAGVGELLAGFTQEAPGPLPRHAETRVVTAEEPTFSGFVFKIQANMDPAHRDRIAFVRIVSGRYEKGMRLYHVRLDKMLTSVQALTFLAASREAAVDAVAGDVIGLHNHGTIQIGDTFTQGESLQFLGIPNFAPELFRQVRLKDPLKQKALLKGLIQLSEEGATQVFRPLIGNDLVLGAVGVLQFDVVAYRLAHEYNVTCAYEAVSVVAARWIECEDETVLARFEREELRHLARDGSGQLTYLAPSRVNLDMMMERWPDITFRETREHRSAVEW